MIARDTYDLLVLGVLLAGGVTFAAVRFIVAPYGRHSRPGWGPTIPARVGWLVMESPSLVLFSAIFFAGAEPRTLPRVLLWAMWTAHYAHRTLIYPLRMKARAKRIPVVVVSLAIVFNVTNATMNASWIAELGEYPPEWTRDPRFLVGVALFVVGMCVNLDADRRLFALRAHDEDGYAIPQGGLFAWVSCPNYLGEIVEWSGWAIASWSLGGAVFALYTVANLAPRAASHHAWYARAFAEYPRDRKALVPLVW